MTDVSQSGEGIVPALSLMQQAAQVATNATPTATPATPAPPTRRSPTAPATCRTGIPQVRRPRSVRGERIVPLVGAVVHQWAILQPGTEQRQAEPVAPERPAERAARPGIRPTRSEWAAARTPLSLDRFSHCQHYRQSEQPRPQHPSHGENPFLEECPTVADSRRIPGSRRTGSVRDEVDRRGAQCPQTWASDGSVVAPAGAQCAVSPTVASHTARNSSAVAPIAPTGRPAGP